MENGFQILIGGNGGTELVEAQHLVTVETEKEVMNYVAQCCNTIEKLGIYGERTAPWVERIGFENVKAVLLDARNVKHFWTVLIGDCGSSPPGFMGTNYQGRGFKKKCIPLNGQN